jgi:hypothetical protein
MRLDKLKALEQYLQREFDVNDTLKLLKLHSLYLATWGAHNYVNVQNKGLMFSVQGHHHKGKVLVSLKWDDTYIVTLINTQNNVKESFENIYCDELADFIDRKVERIADYVR